LFQMQVRIASKKLSLQPYTRTEEDLVTDFVSNRWIRAISASVDFERRGLQAEASWCSINRRHVFYMSGDMTRAKLSLGAAAVGTVGWIEENLERLLSCFRRIYEAGT